jgi:hypothetical protein
MKYLSVILLAFTAFVINTNAQQVQGSGSKVTAEIIASSSTAVVKGAPFSAEAVSESVQTLSDGNKISRSYTTRMFRDGEGRFRREGGGGMGGGAAVGSGGGGNAAALMTYTFSAGGLQDTVSIFDPVSNQRFILNPNNKTALKMPVIPGSSESPVIVNGQSYSYAVKTQIETRIAAQAKAEGQSKAQVVVLPNLTTGTVRGGKTEQLGTRDFEGVTAEGTRTVTTIPAGSIGNERDIEIVYERWYSKDLQLIVYSRHSDPRFGEQIYRLTSISRNEPDRSLFIVPSDYKTTAEPKFNVITTKPM